MFLRSLSARLLVLTVFFVMLGEVLIFVPSVARYRMTYFEDHIAAAHIATLALIASPTGKLDQALTDELLAEVGAHSVTLHRPNGMVQMLDGPEALTPDLRIVLGGGGNVPLMIGRSFATLFSEGNRVISVTATSPFEPDTKVEILLDEAPLRAALWQFGGRIFQLSIILSVMAAVLVYLSLQWLLVRPMRRITASMASFSLDPEDASRVITPRGGRDEIGQAEKELAAMQETVRQALGQRARLAALGTAVTKINHDLRNILATARLVTDGLTTSAAPEVKKVAPRLIDAIDRAVALCSHTLDFSREGAPPLCAEPVFLASADRGDRPGAPGVRRRHDDRARRPGRSRGQSRSRPDLPRLSQSGAQRGRGRRASAARQRYARQRHGRHRCRG